MAMANLISTDVPVSGYVPGQTYNVTVSGDDGRTRYGFQMVLLDSGTFMMGSLNTETGRDADEGPRHQVTLSKAFYMGKHEVTQRVWALVMGPCRSGSSRGPVDSRVQRKTKTECVLGSVSGTLAGPPRCCRKWLPRQHNSGGCTKRRVRNSGDKLAH